MNDVLVPKYDAMIKAIEVAYRVDEVSKIRKAAHALQAAAKIAQNEESERRLAAIRMRAERKAGELLRQSERASGGRPQRGQNPSSPNEGFSTLQDMGISYNQSSQWQRLASVPQRQFDRHIRRVEDGEESTSTQALVREHARRQVSRNLPEVEDVDIPSEEYAAASDDAIECGILIKALKDAVPVLQRLHNVEDGDIEKVQQAFEKAQRAFREGLRKRRPMRVIQGGRR